MGFIDKVNTIAESASKKSSAIMESARINSAISKIMGDLDDLFYELGRSYYDNNKTKSTGPHYDIIEKIQLAELEIKKQEEKLLDLKGLLCCPNCDAILSKDDEFCNKCGDYVLEGKNVKQINICANCGEETGADLAYCPRCGFLTKMG